MAHQCFALTPSCCLRDSFWGGTPPSPPKTDEIWWNDSPTSKTPRPSAGWQASGGRATIPLSFFKDAFVFRNLLSFNLTVTLSTSYGYGESHSLGYVKVQENVSPTAVNQALGSHVEIIQTSFFFHTHPRLKPCLIFHDSCLIIHPIIWAILAVWHVQVVHSLPPAAVDMHWSRKWEGYMAEIFYVVV